MMGFGYGFWNDKVLKSSMHNNIGGLAHTTAHQVNQLLTCQCECQTVQLPEVPEVPVHFGIMKYGNH